MGIISPTYLSRFTSSSEILTISSSEPKLFTSDVGSFQNCDAIDSLKFRYQDTNKMAHYALTFCNSYFIVMDENSNRIAKIKSDVNIRCNKITVISGAEKEADEDVLGVICQKNIVSKIREREENDSTDLLMVSVNIKNEEISIPQKEEQVSILLKDLTPFTMNFSPDGGKTVKNSVGLYKWIVDPTKPDITSTSFYIYSPELEEGTRVKEIKKPDTIKEFTINSIISASSSDKAYNTILVTAFFTKPGESQSNIGIFKVVLDPNTREVTSFILVPGNDGKNRIISLDNDVVFYEDFQNKEFGLCIFDWLKADKFDFTDEKSCSKISNLGLKSELKVQGISNCNIDFCGVFFSDSPSQVKIVQYVGFKDRAINNEILSYYSLFTCDKIAVTNKGIITYRKEGLVTVFDQFSSFIFEINSSSLDPKQTDYSVDLAIVDYPKVGNLKVTLKFKMAKSISEGQTAQLLIKEFNGFLQEENTLPINRENFKGNALNYSITSVSDQNTKIEILNVNKVEYFIQDETKTAKPVIPLGPGIVAKVNSDWWYYYCDVKITKISQISCSYKVNLTVDDEAEYAGSKRYNNVVLIHFRVSNSISQKSIIVVYDEFIKTKSIITYEEVVDFITNYYFKGDKIYFSTKQKTGSGFGKIMVQNSYSLPKFITIYELKEENFVYKTLSSRIYNKGDAIWSVVALKSSITLGINQLVYKRINLNSDPNTIPTVSNMTYNFSDSTLNSAIAFSSKTCSLDGVIIFFSPEASKVMFIRVEFDLASKENFSPYLKTRILDLSSLGFSPEYEYFCSTDVDIFSFLASKKSEKGVDEYYLIILDKDALDSPDNYIRQVVKLDFNPNKIYHSYTDKHLFFQIYGVDDSTLISVEINGPRFYYSNKNQQTTPSQNKIKGQLTDNISQGQTKIDFEFNLQLTPPKIIADIKKKSSFKLEKKQFMIYDLIDVDGPEGSYSLSKETTAMKVTQRLKNKEGEKLTGKNGEMVTPKSLKMVRNGDIFGLVDNNLSTVFYHWLSSNFKSFQDLGAFCDKLEIETLSITKYMIYMICSEEQIRRPRVILYDTSNDQIKYFNVVSNFINFDISRVVFLRIDENNVWLILDDKKEKNMVIGTIDVSENSFNERYQELKRLSMSRGNFLK